MSRAVWLESHDEFEGVGAHELNPRYDHVDGGDWDEALTLDRLVTPALFRAQRLLAAVAVPIRFDGADLSHHNADAGPIDWPTLRAASSWCATKATQSTSYVDPTFATHRAQMQAQQFTYRLFYHWLSSTTDPTLQALHFLETVGDWYEGDGAMLDNEEAGNTVDRAQAWFEVVEKERRRPGTHYTGAYVAGGTMWQSTKLRTSIFGTRRGAHLAAYTTEVKAKALPGVAAYPWSAWQYSSNGPVPGVVGRCDMNRIDVLAHYDLACGVNPQQEVDMDAITFEVTDLPGIYLWAPGMPAPVPFDVPASFTTIAPAMGAVPCGAKLSQEMYRRLFVVPPIDADALAAKVAAAIKIPALTGHIAADLGAEGHITGSVG